VKPVRQRQRPVNPSLEATIRKEVEKLLKAQIIFPVKYSEWVSNLVLCGRKLVRSGYVLTFVL
jgi:hypothetical protein